MPTMILRAAKMLERADFIRLLYLIQKYMRTRIPRNQIDPADVPHSACQGLRHARASSSWRFSLTHEPRHRTRVPSELGSKLPQSFKQLSLL